MHALVIGARPKTLLISVMPVVLVAGITGGPWSLVLSALASAVLIQIGTNLVNDVADFERGADTAERVGPQRVTQSGLCRPRTVWMAAGAAFVGSVIAALPLIYAGGLPLLIVGLLSIAAAYGYTAGPYPLAYRGLGEVFVFVFFGPVAVLTLAWLFRGGSVEVGDAVAAAQAGLLAVVLLAINNIRDLAQDARAEKKTLAVRIGDAAYRRLAQTCVLLPLALGFVWLGLGNVGAALLPVLVLPLALKVVRALGSPLMGRQWNPWLAQAAALHAVFLALLLLGDVMGRTLAV